MGHPDSNETPKAEERAIRPLDRLAQAESWLAGFGLLLMLLLVCMEITIRNLFNTSFLWSEELSRYLLIWSTYFAAVSLIHRRGHLRIELIIDRTRGRLRKALEIFSDLWILIFSAALAGAGYQLVTDSFLFGFRSSDSNFPLELAWVYLVIPVTFALSALHTAASLLRLIRKP